MMSIQSFRRQWKLTLLGHLAVIVAALVLGAVVEQVLGLLTFSLLAIISWHLGKLWQLGNWNSNQPVANPAPGIGAWNAVFADTQRRMAESKRR